MYVALCVNAYCTFSRMFIEDTTYMVYTETIESIGQQVQILVANIVHLAALSVSTILQTQSVEEDLNNNENSQPSADKESVADVTIDPKLTGPSRGPDLCEDIRGHVSTDITIGDKHH